MTRHVRSGRDSSLEGRGTLVAVARRLPLLAFACLVAGCGGGQEVRPAATAAIDASSPPSVVLPAGDGSAAPVVVRDAARAKDARCRPGRHRVTGFRTAVALGAVGPVVARQAPRADARVVATMPEVREHGLRTVLLALEKTVERDCRTGWYRVRLPRRPNGLVGWVRAWNVVERRLETRVVVDLDARRLTVFRRGRPVLAVPVAVGKDATPTPPGAYFIDRRYKLRDPHGVFGPAILAVSGFSEAPQGWARDNPIAVHGTSDPGSIGQAASAGCIRVRNDHALRLLDMLPTGTPIVIR